jgi:hypothetical protein
MDLFKKRKKESENLSIYSGLRQQVLDLKPSPELRVAMNGHPVYASIVDMDLGNGIVTLACVADGTTSLYFSSGGGQLGLGQAHEAVRSATTAFLSSSEQVLDKLTPTKVFPLPTHKKHMVYLITEQNIYSQEFDMEKVDTYPRELQFLNFLYQNVISKIGETKGK